MDGRFHMRSGLEDITLVHRFDASAAEEKAAWEASAAAERLASTMLADAGDTELRFVAQALLERLGESSADLARWSDAELAAVLCAHVERGEVLVMWSEWRVEAPRRGEGRGAPARAAATAPAPRVPKAPVRLTFIEILVTDEDGVPYDGPFRLKLPDGSTREGQLASGHAYIDGIPPGSCELQLPELDGPAWRAA